MTLLTLILTLPVHAAPPTRELLDDIERWEAGQDAFLDGPPGCWDLTGTTRQVLTFHQPPDFFSAGRNEAFPTHGVVRGRLIDGVWQGKPELERKENPDSELELDFGVYPLFGSLPKSDKEEPEEEQLAVSVGDGQAQVSGSVGHSVNLLREAVEEWSGSVETSLASWDAEQQAVLYEREVPVSDKDSRPIAITVRFPEAAATADRIDAVWPALIKLGDWPLRFKIRDAQMHAVGHRVEDKVFPWAESLSFVGGIMGFTFGYEQRIQWVEATPCTVTSEPETTGGEE